ncbi:MAG: ABC transporter ATP-binding protein [Castellaniella sp.]
MRQMESGQKITIEGVTRHFGATRALDGIDLTVKSGELLTILGPSGSGKTTLLKIIAGFEQPDTGCVKLGDEDVTDTTPARRGIGMVFQNYALFPHMTVAENIGFPLVMRKVPRATREKQVEEALALIDLPGYGDRLPKQLSGGQQQRVALARAVVFGPRLLLLDEPFGALDRKLREQMQLEVCRLQRKLGLTAIFVTHDQEEALIMSDRIAIMDAGEIAQIGTPQEIYRYPVNRFVAGFIGESNLFPARMVSPGRAQTPDGMEVLVPASAAAPVEEIGLLLRPERARNLVGEMGADTMVTGTVLEVVYLGSSIKYRLRLEHGSELIVRWPLAGAGTEYAVGDTVRVGWDQDDIHLIEWS